jgi:hypothetical protein
MLIRMIEALLIAQAAALPLAMLAGRFVGFNNSVSAPEENDNGVRLDARASVVALDVTTTAPRFYLIRGGKQ